MLDSTIKKDNTFTNLESCHPLSKKKRRNYSKHIKHLSAISTTLICFKAYTELLQFVVPFIKKKSLLLRKVAA